MPTTWHLDSFHGGKKEFLIRLFFLYIFLDLFFMINYESLSGS